MPSTESSPTFRPQMSQQFLVIGLGLILTVTVAYAVFTTYFLVATDHSAPIERFSTVAQEYGLSVPTPRVTTGAVAIAHQTTFEMSIEGKPVWLVYFDAFDPAQAKALEKVKSDGSIEVDGQPQAAKVLGTVALAGYRGQPEEQRLLAAFAEFQAPGK